MKSGEKFTSYLKQGLISKKFIDHDSIFQQSPKSLVIPFSTNPHHEQKIFITRLCAGKKQIFFLEILIRGFLLLRYFFLCTGNDNRGTLRDQMVNEN